MGGLLAQWVGHFDSALGWLERTPVGQRVIASAVAVALAAWGLVREVPAFWLVLIALNVTAMMLYIQERAVPWMRKKLRPTVRVEISHALETTDSLQFPLLVLNTSTGRRVSLAFSYIAETASVPRRVFSMHGAVSDVNGNLGPGEQDERMVSIRLGSPDVPPLLSSVSV
jgi:hypothetical protein